VNAYHFESLLEGFLGLELVFFHSGELFFDLAHLEAEIPLYRLDNHVGGRSVEREEGPLLQAEEGRLVGEEARPRHERPGYNLERPQLGPNGYALGDEHSPQNVGQHHFEINIILIDARIYKL